MINKIVLSTLFFVVSYLTLQAQDFQATAVYQSNTNTSDFKSKIQGNKDITPDMQKMLEDRMKAMFEKTYILSFDKTTSIYKEEEKLDAPGTAQNGGGMKMFSSMMGGGGTFYKNIKDKAYTVDKEFMGKEFLVKDSLPKLKWKMESETKQIGGYTCSKATATRKPSKSDFRNLRPKKDDDKKEGAKKPADDKKTNFMDEVDLPKEITVIAWYAPEIPVSQGPENYWGLPGLILEVTDGKTTILCSKVVLNTKGKVEIKAPTNGKVISQSEYDETVIKKMKELQEMNQGRGPNGAMQMRIGG
jgi:GLPGLI family protein